jgi:hypothetical protein
MLMTNSIEKEILVDVLSNPGDIFYENVLSDFLDEQGIEHDFRKPLHKKMITELKPYQEKCLDIWKNYWISVGLCTKPTDESKTEQYFFDLYEQLYLRKPKKIIWFDNPVEMCNQVNNQLINKARNQVRYQVNGQIYYQVNSQVYYQVSHLLHHIWNKVSLQRRRICNHTNDQMLNNIWYGQQDADWFAFFSYCMQVLRMEAPKSTIPYMLLAQEVNWWFLLEKTVFVTRKPKECIVENGEIVKLVYQDNYTIT